MNNIANNNDVPKLITPSTLASCKSSEISPKASAPAVYAKSKFVEDLDGLDAPSSSASRSSSVQSDATLRPTPQKPQRPQAKTKLDAASSVAQKLIAIALFGLGYAGLGVVLVATTPLALTGLCLYAGLVLAQEAYRQIAQRSAQNAGAQPTEA